MVPYTKYLFVKFCQTNITSGYQPDERMTDQFAIYMDQGFLFPITKSALVLDQHDALQDDPSRAENSSVQANQGIKQSPKC